MSILKNVKTVISQSSHLRQLLRCQSRCLSQHERQFVPRRAAMYVPGNDEKKLRKIEGLDVDCVVMDCEDGVALNRKDEARTTIRKMLDELKFGRAESVVRINSVGSGLAQEDLKVTLGADRLPQTVMLPKVEDPDQINWFSDNLASTLDRRKGWTSAEKLNLVIFVESAIGLLNLQRICSRGIELSSTGPFHLDGIVFGSDDFCADIGATRTEDAKELLYARQKVVLVAKAYRLQAIDMVHINFNDLEGLRKQCIEGAHMGFTGKQVIHPKQVPIVQESFTPSDEKVKWATELIEQFEEHQKSGKGAFTFRGNMIDMPLLLQAKNIVQLIEAMRAS